MGELKLKCLKRKKETMFVLKRKKGFAHHTIKFTFFSKVLSILWMRILNPSRVMLK